MAIDEALLVEIEKLKNPRCDCQKNHVVDNNKFASPAEEKELKETLHEIIGEGKKVTVEQKIDPSIYGGLIVEFQQKLLDMSIKTRAQQMERLHRELVDLKKLFFKDSKERDNKGRKRWLRPSYQLGNQEKSETDGFRSIIKKVNVGD